MRAFSVRAASLAVVTFVALAAPAASPATAGAASRLRPADLAADWVEQSLPTGYAIAGGLPANPMAPVSCVTGTTFCAVIASDVANPPAAGGEDPQAVFVTTDGSTWSTSGDLPTGPQYTAISCPATSVCYVAGGGGTDGAVLKTVDGGQTWAVAGATPAGPNSIDCVSATVCWTTFEDGDSGTSYTINGGKTWSGGADLSSSATTLDAISCWNAGGNCVAAGGVNNENGGQATVITESGGQWQASASPILNEISIIFSVSCVPGASAETCYAVGASDNAGDAQGGPVELVSTDGGQTWSATEFTDAGGWLNSISCADASDCWAAGAGTTLALTGTDDAGSTWYPDSVSDTDQLNSVSCASVDFCAATADNALWVTTDDGGITTAAPPSPSITQPMPLVTPSTVSTSAGTAATVIGQDRQVKTGTSVTASVRLPDGHAQSSHLRTGKFFFYSVRLSSLPIGSTRIQFDVGGRTVRTVTIRAIEHGRAVKPRISSARRATARIGRKFSFTLRVSGSPAPLVWLTGKLPKGITFDATTGRLSGTAARGTRGVYAITFTASNGAKPDAVQHFKLSVVS
jgi:Putative Ig domain